MPPTEKRWGHAVDIATVILLCAVVALLLRNSSSSRTRAGPIATSFSQLADTTWEKLWADAHVRGLPSAEMRLLLFSDVECPFCRSFTDSLRNWDGYRDTSLAIGLLHFPLSQHRFARPGANAIECASSISDPWTVYEALVLGQAAFGSMSQQEILSAAGVNTNDDFASCVTEERFATRIDAQVNSARQIGVSGTPGIVVNGRLFDRPPTVKTLDSLLRELRK